MSDSHEYSLMENRRFAPPVLLPALLFSVMVHAAAGLLFGNWRHVPVEMPQSLLTVTLEAPPVPVMGSVPTDVKRHYVNPELHPVQALPMHTVPTLDVARGERVEVADLVTPAPNTESAPSVIADAPAVVNAPVRRETIEPHHTDVVYRKYPMPAYPTLAHRLGLEGQVVLRVQVMANGVPEKVTVARTSGVPLLDEAALKAVWGWIVSARRGDTPIADVVEVPIRFQLKN